MKQFAVAIDHYKYNIRNVAQQLSNIDHVLEEQVNTAFQRKHKQVYSIILIRPIKCFARVVYILKIVAIQTETSLFKFIQVSPTPFFQPVFFKDEPSPSLPYYVYCSVRHCSVCTKLPAIPDLLSSFGRFKTVPESYSYNLFDLNYLSRYFDCINDAAIFLKKLSIFLIDGKYYTRFNYVFDGFYLYMRYVIIQQLVCERKMRTPHISIT